MAVRAPGLRLLQPLGFRVRVFSASSETGLRDFLTAVGRGVEAHADKIEKEVGGMKELLLMRSGILKKISVPCKQRKLILRYTEKYRQGVWRPRKVATSTPA